MRPSSRAEFPPGGRRGHAAVLAALLLLPLVLLLAGEPLPQDPLYHALADGRTLFGVPNFFNVASNLAFLLAALPGLAACFSGRTPGARHSWTVFFAGVALVSLGSAYYHWDPRNATLVWDRLPMTLGFAGLFAAVLSEHLGARLERLLLPCAVAAGIASVLWWHYADDLRLYVWVQFAPLAALLYALAVLPARYARRAWLWCALGCYALAKIAELHDPEIYGWTAHAVSGHVLKHLLAALGALALAWMLWTRAAHGRRFGPG
jgi:hypothetical protein